MQEGGHLLGQYDRVLRCLERRLGASDTSRNRGMRERIRAAVRDVLAPPDNADLVNHLALLELSRDAEGRVRLLTTNFDTLFERAWFGEHHTAIESHAGLAMPQPKTARCTGVLHLHGRLADPKLVKCFDTDLVLTSAEFGDAYLRLELERALWYAKAVEPILYTANYGDHSSLYDSLREWRRYAGDPTGWRRERLRAVLSESPSSLPDATIRECAALLSHGDASQLLGELSPTTDWLPTLVEQRVFGRQGAGPGDWIATRLNDADMIRGCAGLPFFDERTRWEIDRAVERERTKLAPVHVKAWQLMLSATQPPLANDIDASWYQMASHIKEGDVGFKARRLIVEILRPRLKVEKAFRWREEGAAPGELEALH